MRVWRGERSPELNSGQGFWSAEEWSDALTDALTDALGVVSVKAVAIMIHEA